MAEPKPQLDDQTDEEILGLSLTSPRAFELLIDRYEKPFLRRARKILGSNEDAEDAVQETFTRIYLYGKRFKSKENASFKSWGYKILSNTCYTVYMKRKKHLAGRVDLSFGGEDEKGWRMEHFPDSEDFVEREYVKDTVALLLAELPAKTSRLFSRHFFGGLQYKEIAAEEGISEGAVKVRIHRAKKQLQTIYLKWNNDDTYNV